VNHLVLEGRSRAHDREEAGRESRSHGSYRGKEIEILLDSQEAATVLGVHPRTLQRMAQRGEIAGVQVGKLWRFRGSSLAAWIDRRSSPDALKTA